MEEQIAKRAAAKAGAALPVVPIVPQLKSEKAKPEHSPSLEQSGEVEASPDSGVRSSQDPDALQSAFDNAGPARPLTYSMYTISELEGVESHSLRGPASAAPPPQVVGFAELQRSGIALARTFVSFLRMPSPRPRVLDVCRLPLIAFSAELRAVMARLPWKRLAVGFAVGFGSLLLLLVAVVALADLTDDVRPTHSGKQVPVSAATTRVAEDVAPKASPLPPAPVETTAAASDVVELGDVDETAAPKPMPAPFKKARAAKKPQPQPQPTFAPAAPLTERFIP
jgi:hypothetical protein